MKNVTKVLVTIGFISLFVFAIYSIVELTEYAFDLLWTH